VRGVVHGDLFGNVLPCANDCSLGNIFERGDELCDVIFGDPPQFADLDAAELASSEQVVDLVAADVQHVGDLLDCECLQVCESPPYIAHEVRLRRTDDGSNITVRYHSDITVRYLAEMPDGVHGISGKAANERLAALTGSARTPMATPANTVMGIRPGQSVTSIGGLSKPTTAVTAFGPVLTAASARTAATRAPARSRPIRR
jgi:hypothetical protein